MSPRHSSHISDGAPHLAPHSSHIEARSDAEGIIAVRNGLARLAAKWKTGGEPYLLMRGLSEAYGVIHVAVQGSRNGGELGDDGIRRLPAVMVGAQTDFNLGPVVIESFVGEVLGAGILKLSVVVCGVRDKDRFLEAGREIMTAMGNRNSSPRNWLDWTEELLRDNENWIDI
ncbi:MAG: hypothetical protein M1829_003704 [Trizodia sp. TS-e1964]|nr:MAG: hypothetical protein M1829_003704 [Trizodia sp. TS-e1964]